MRSIKKQLMGPQQKRQPTRAKVHDTGDFSVLTENRFDSLTIKPSLEENSYMTDGGLVFSDTQKDKGRNAGMNPSQNSFTTKERICKVTDYSEVSVEKAKEQLGLHSVVSHCRL